MRKQLSEGLRGRCKPICARLRRFGGRMLLWIKGQNLGGMLADLIRKNRPLVILAVLALSFSLAGYTVGGLSFFDAVYAAAALFFVNPVTDISNALVLLGKYLSLAVAAGIVLNVVKYAFRMAGHYRINRYDDSTAVYTDNPWGERLATRLKHGYISTGKKNGQLEDAKHHILMYSDDMKNLNLYARHRDELAREGAQVYIMLSHVDAFLLNGDASDRVEGPRYFNIHDMIARDYWMKHDLYEEAKGSGRKPVRVAVIGYGEIGQAICKYAVLNNVYWPDQAIEYHVWGCRPYQKRFLEAIDLMNGDEIRVHTTDCLDDLDLLKTMYRVILTGKDDIELLQQLLYIAPDTQLHVYVDGESDLAGLYAHSEGQLVCFGNPDTILTEQNIKQDELFRKAKLLHYDYVLQAAFRRETAEAERSGKQVSESRRQQVRTTLPPDYERLMDVEWRKLSGFLKGSNIARADHLRIEARIRQEPDPSCVGSIASLEHIRWCRFHFYNHWSYDPERMNRDPDKDEKYRRHGLLTSDLPDRERGKDSVFNERIYEEIS